MDHDMVVRQKMTERYLLNELDPAARDEFEEHFFDCKDCAFDVQAGALFVEQSKVVLAEKPEPVAAALPATASVRPKPGWLAWFRPAVVVPVERYTAERKAEFLLSTATTEKDYRRARKEVKRLGLDPDVVPHRQPE